VWFGLQDTSGSLKREKGTRRGDFRTRNLPRDKEGKPLRERRKKLSSNWSIRKSNNNGSSTSISNGKKNHGVRAKRKGLRGQNVFS